MTAYKITSFDSVFTPAGSAFSESGSGHSLTVDDSAYLISTHPALADVLLGGTGKGWTVTVNGIIFSQTSTALDIAHTGPSTITVGANGEIVTAGIGPAINLAAPATIKNAGLIASGGFGAVSFNGTGTSSFTNSGSVVGSVSASNGPFTLANSGKIDGTVSSANQNDKFTNSGDITGDVSMGQGNNTYMSTTATSSARNILAGSGLDIVSIAGRVDETIFLSFGANKLTVTKTGVIENGNLEVDAVILRDDNDTVINDGIINGNVDLGDGDNSYKSSNAVSQVDSITAFDGNDTVSIAGVVHETVQLGNGNNKFTLTKTGVVDNFLNAVNAFASGSGDDIFSNAGRIDGAVALGDGNNSFTNSGTVNGHVTSINGITAKFTNSGILNGSVGFSTAKTTISNSGTINGGLNGSTIADTFSNSGTITGSITLNGGDDIVTNSGTIGSLSLGDGNDKVTNTGTVGGTIDLGDGQDFFTGGSASESVKDSSGNDNVKFGAGNDFYTATGAASDGVDVIDGGAGVDMYFAVDAVEDMRVNIDTVSHDVAIINDPSSPIDAKTAFIFGKGLDVITGFEDVEGGDGNDIIFGNASANTLVGSNGDDALFGLGGNDFLQGFNDDDRLIGGLGADILRSDFGQDQFIYISTADSGITKATRDVIKDFEDGQDKINLSLIDANTKNGSAINDGFSYVNVDSSVDKSAVFTKEAPGELRSYWTATGHILEGDVNGDGKADFSIAVDDPTHAIVFTQDDFIL